MAQPLKAVDCFQFSPIAQAGQDETTSDEEDSRFCLMMHERVHKVLQLRLGENSYYRGGVASLGDKFLAFLAGAKTGEVLLVISCHGERGTGSFLDSYLTARFAWTAEGLWHGLVFRSGTSVNSFDGLRALLSAAPSVVRITIVLAPCYGAYFADRLRGLVQANPLFGKEVAVVGLSYGPTHRVLDGDRRASRYAHHHELTAWIEAGMPTSPGLYRAPSASATQTVEEIEGYSGFRQDPALTVRVKDI